MNSTRLIITEKYFLKKTAPRACRIEVKDGHVYYKKYVSNITEILCPVVSISIVMVVFVRFIQSFRKFQGAFRKYDVFENLYVIFSLKGLLYNKRSIVLSKVLSNKKQKIPTDCYKLKCFSSTHYRAGLFKIYLHVTLKIIRYVFFMKTAHKQTTFS